LKHEGEKIGLYEGMMSEHMLKLIKKYQKEYGERYAMGSFSNHLQAILEQKTYKNLAFSFRANVEEGKSMEEMAKKDAEKLIDWCLRGSKLLEDETTIEEVKEERRKTQEAMDNLLRTLTFSVSPKLPKSLKPLENTDEHEEEEPENEAGTSEGVVEPQNPATTDEEDPDLPPLVGFGEPVTETSEEEIQVSINMDGKPELSPEDRKRLIKITKRKIFFMNRVLKNYGKRFSKREQFPDFESKVQERIEATKQELKALQNEEAGGILLYKDMTIDEVACKIAHVHIRLIGRSTNLFIDDEAAKMGLKAKKNCSKHK
ncbi:hypothetical protein ACFL6I_21755, partial [candidate division KSB1 bacterium]